jgi:mevalonate kinase
VTWYIPSKTFMLGEYAALYDLPAIILNSSPYFVVEVIGSFDNYSKDPSCRDSFSPSMDSADSSSNIHPASPAGRFLQDKAISLKFTDPHQGSGGFGASSAQFVGAYLAAGYKDTAELLELYYKYAWSGLGLRPSGYDVLAQFAGASMDPAHKAREDVFFSREDVFFSREDVFFSREDVFCAREEGLFAREEGLFSREEGGNAGSDVVFLANSQTTPVKYAWPFADLGFILLPTGAKLKTHEHLQAVSEVKQVSVLGEIVLAAHEALQCKDAKRFIETIRAYYAGLCERNLVSKLTQEKIVQILDIPEVLAAKGCGAMGADVILVFGLKTDLARIADLS